MTNLTLKQLYELDDNVRQTTWFEGEYNFMNYDMNALYRAAPTMISKLREMEKVVLELQTALKKSANPYDYVWSRDSHEMGNEEPGWNALRYINYIAERALSASESITNEIMECMEGI